MKTYKVFISQEGGCDYTIACGETIVDINAESIAIGEGAQVQAGASFSIVIGPSVAHPN